MHFNGLKQLTFFRVSALLAIVLIFICIQQTRQGLPRAIEQELTEIVAAKPDKNWAYIELSNDSVTYSSHTQLLPYHATDSVFVQIRNTVWCQKPTGNRIYFVPLSADYGIVNQLLQPTSFLTSHALIKLEQTPGYQPLVVSGEHLWFSPQPSFSPVLFFLFFALLFACILHSIFAENKLLLQRLLVFSGVLYFVFFWFPISLESIPLFSAELYSAGRFVSNYPTLLALVAVLSSFFGWMQLYVSSRMKPIIFGFWLIGYVFVTWCMQSLVIHSSAVFSFSNIFSLEPSNLAALFLILFLGVFILISVRAVLYIKFRVITIVVGYAVLNVLAYAFHYVDLLEINWHIALILISIYYHKKSNQPYLVALVIACCSLAFVYEKHMNYKAESRARLIADDLMHNDDPVAKYFFREKLSNISKEMSLIDLKAVVLNGYLSQFNLGIEKTGNTIDSVQFHSTTIYLFQPEKSSKGYLPDILIDRAISNIATKGYDWRVFKANKLLFESAFALGYNPNRRSISFEQANYAAEIYFPNKPTFHYAGLAALLLLLLSIPTVLAYLVSYAFNFQSIRNRIIMGSLISMLLVTAIITYFSFQSVEKMVTQDLYQSISDKIKYSTKLLEGYSTTEIIEAVSQSKELNLYALNGNLVATGQAEVFEQDLLPYEISSKVGYQVRNSPSGIVILSEKIGELAYYSAFQYVRNQEGEVAGMLNLTYLGLQNIHNARLEELLTNILMVAILFTMLWFVVALMYYRKATQPLAILEKSFAELKLETENAPIAYKGNDEIGQLVKVYNQKVLELRELIARLAQSEREKAWREMAKQVAHEIKNPLTPMKLNTQMFLKRLEKSPDDLEERAKEFCESMVQQIDTLTNIANTFSQYARVAQSHPEMIDLLEALTKCKDFFKESSSTEFSVSGESASVWFDKDQLTRVLNNLVTNAQQAFKEQENNQISFVISETENQVKLTIKDNGPGIPEDIQGKIFHPYFTTKSTGTGIGLSMVKQMMEHHGGEISFESSSAGTTFTLLFNRSAIERAD